VNFSKLINRNFLRRDADAEPCNNNKFLKPLTKWYKIYVVRFLVIKVIVVPKCLKIFSLVPKCPLDTAEMSWVRSGLGPKCPYTEQSATRLTASWFVGELSCYNFTLQQHKSRLLQTSAAN